MARQTSTRRTFIKTISASALGISLAGNASATRSVSEAPIPDQTSDLEYATMGTDASNPTATLYGNFKCPYTQDFVNNNLKDVLDKFVDSGRLNLEFRALAYQPPGTTSHGSSTYYISSSDPRISEVALSAWDVQPTDYWGFFEMMFDSLVSGTVTHSEMENHLQEANVSNRSTIIDRAKDGQYDTAVKETANDAGSVGVSFTPTLELNGETTPPHHEPETLLNWIESRLSSTSSTSTITIDGSKTETWTNYDFVVSGSVEKSEANGASINPADTVSGSEVNGGVGPWKDSYTFTGDITSFNVTKGAEIYLNGEKVDPANLG
ncbi:DsbA family protein [Haladaptatus salinisoli]|uniref:DsbA family protein n=1 Tax=Haladaptatus salinisoli TaxID=2884876 RepID=UPI001D09ED44|nr:thioredoxin domain-containing protein [Haladaptatus salinisoli]